MGGIEAHARAQARGAGLLPLFAVPWPPQGIFAKKEINQIADMKGLSWRVYNASTQRIAQIVDASPVTIQAADLQEALATGLINAFMTSVATGVDVKVWESMGYFYDTQAWLPKNVTFVNKTAFDQLDRPTQESCSRSPRPPKRAAGGGRRKRPNHTRNSLQLMA